MRFRLYLTKYSLSESETPFWEQSQNNQCKLFRFNEMFCLKYPENDTVSLDINFICLHLSKFDLNVHNTIYFCIKLIVHSIVTYFLCSPELRKAFVVILFR